MQAAGVTGRELAAALHVVPSTVSQWINGRRTPHVKDVEHIEKKLGTNGYLKRQLEKWVSRETSPEWFEWRRVEEEMTELLAIETSLINGLLQSPDYARTILQSEDLLEQRLARQEILHRENAPFFDVLLDESILYRKVGNAKIMADALARVVELVESDNIVARVLPLNSDVGGQIFCPFHLATVDGGGQVAFVEAEIGGKIVERPTDLSRLRRKWARSSAEALSRQASVDLIQRTIKERWTTA
jgi:transcriptional regulator with XRE-family HTH domain